ncbi:elongation factor Ts, mitochondrial-like [Biomphalaria glabrata]|uniref:Elongation factor Ts, mitochondrial n=1 Tax=Biomphalaria glabrata TaxID=6526 RepID=A0A9U8EEL6_BIOGL|nr:elongation factor Ts, mitochondrial-like [Biomphalaria glabrata]
MTGMHWTLKPRIWHFLQSSARMYSTEISVGADKTLLSKLRKQTGFTFSNCKKALTKFNNDYDQAKKWLVEEAQKEGWARATKLQTRPMSQGLVAIVADNKQATMIEVNCETDFVARNDKFTSLVTKLAQECSAYFEALQEKEVSLGKAELDQIKSSEATTLADLVVLNVANLGENMSLRRGVFIKADIGTVLSTYVHPNTIKSQSSQKVLLGKYGAIVEMRQAKTVDKPALSLSDLGSHLCQHIVGMNPRTIGEYIPREKKEEPVEEKPLGDEDEATSDTEGSSKVVEVEDDRLLNQEFLLDTSMTVGELVSLNEVEILQFRRFACGEELEDEKQ